jgi:hypothetical protein
VLHNNATMDTHGVTEDAVVEGGTVRDSDSGINVAGSTSLVVLRKNVFENVKTPRSGDGVSRAAVIPR